MELNGYVQNGVVVFAGGATLPEGTSVTISCDAPSEPPKVKKRVQLPLVRSKTPGQLRLTSEMIGEILDDEEMAAGR